MDIHISRFTQDIVSRSGARKSNVSLVTVPHYRRSSCKILVLPVCGEILQKSCVCFIILSIGKAALQGQHK